MDGEEVKNIDEVEEDEISLNVVAPTTPLEDKRRTRTKSVGRPPSQVFLKTTLQSNFSMEADQLSATEDEVDKPTEDHLNLVTRIVSDMKKSTISSYTSNSSTRTSAGWKNVVLKKTTTVKGSNVEDKTPSWIKELRERKTHKLSLGEEDLSSLERERTTIVEMNITGTQNQGDGYKIVKSTISTTTDGTGPPKIVVNETTTTREQAMRPRRSLRRHTVHTNFDEVSPTTPPPVEEPPKNNRGLEEVVEKVNSFIAHSKSFREKVQQDLCVLEATMNSQFERHVEELEEIKNKVSSIINNHAT